MQLLRGAGRAADPDGEVVRFALADAHAAEALVDDADDGASVAGALVDFDPQEVRVRRRAAARR